MPTSTLCGWLKASSQKLLDCNRTQDTGVKLITLTENNSNTKMAVQSKAEFSDFPVSGYDNSGKDVAFAA